MSCSICAESKRYQQQPPQQPLPQTSQSYSPKPLQSTYLYLQRNLLPLNPPDHNLRRILRDDLIVMQHLELLRRVLAHVREQRLRAAGVLVQPVRHVEHDALDGDPEIVFLVVLGDLVESDLAVGDFEGGGFFGSVVKGSVGGKEEGL